MKNKAAQQLGRLGGSVTSEAKAIAARANGAKGGRPATPYTLESITGEVVSKHKSLEAAYVAQTRKGLIGVSTIKCNGTPVKSVFTGI